MEGFCTSCQQVQRKFYCTNCLGTHLREFKTATQRAASEREAELGKVTKTLSIIQPGRLLRADQARLENSIQEIEQETSLSKKRIEQGKSPRLSPFPLLTTDSAAGPIARIRVQVKRDNLAARRANLASAKQMIATSARALITSQINSATSRLHSIDQSLAVTRKVLIKNLVEAFDLREAIPPTTPTGTGGGDNYMLPFAVNSASFIDAGRALFGRGMGMSAIAGGLGQSLLGDKKPVVPGKGEWSIAGLVLPVPGDVRRYPDDHVTAAVSHTLHFLRLLTFYLGVKLPFEIFWSGGLPGVGLPSIAISPGNSRFNWDKQWNEMYPLYLITPDPTPDTNASQSSSSTKPSLDAFKTALCMLNYNIAYLSHTQGLEVPLNLTGETLRNIWSICCINTPDFARFSHATPSLTHPLSPPTSFKLEFAQILQSVVPPPPPPAASTSSSGSKRRSRSSKSRKGATAGIADEWDLVEIEEGDEGVG